MLSLTCSDCGHLFDYYCLTCAGDPKPPIDEPLFTREEPPAMPRFIVLPSWINLEFSESGVDVLRETCGGYYIRDTVLGVHAVSDGHGAKLYSDYGEADRRAWALNKAADLRAA